MHFIVHDAHAHLSQVYFSGPGCMSGLHLQLFGSVLSWRILSTQKLQFPVFNACSGNGKAECNICVVGAVVVANVFSVMAITMVAICAFCALVCNKQRLSVDPSADPGLDQVSCR